MIYRTVTNADYRRVDRGHWMLDGCHLWLPMQDAAGGMCYDWSGKGHHGTLTGMDPATDWTTGKLGRALDFDGSNDSVNVGNIVEPAGGTGYTFTAWVRRAGSSTYALFGQSDNNVRRHLVYLRSAGHVRVILGDGGGSFITPDNGTATTLDKWHHVAVTFEFAGEVKIYVDGVLARAPSVAGSISHIDTDGNSDAVGARQRTSSTSDLSLNGQMADVRYWNRALSQSEIRAVYSDPWQAIGYRRRVFHSIPPEAPPGNNYNSFIHAQIGSC